MAYDTILYGCIDCFFTSGRADWRLLWKHNSAVIAELPERNEHVLLGRDLFTAEENSYRIQVIHFGGAFKNFSLNWRQWLDDFECLLRRLYWNNARLHLEDEELGQAVCRWTSRHESWQLALREPPVLRVEWDFEWQTDSGIDPRQFPIV